MVNKCRITVSNYFTDAYKVSKALDVNCKNKYLKRMSVICFKIFQREAEAGEMAWCLKGLVAEGLSLVLSTRLSVIPFPENQCPLLASTDTAYIWYTYLYADKCLYI